MAHHGRSHGNSQHEGRQHACTHAQNPICVRASVFCGHAHAHCQVCMRTRARAHTHTHTLNASDAMRQPRTLRHATAVGSH
eukprot:88702-Alexandrium_andersonii.AAC.1